MVENISYSESSVSVESIAKEKKTPTSKGGDDERWLDLCKKTVCD